MKPALLSSMILTAISYNVQADSKVDYFELSIEELLNIEPNIGSFSQETVASSPSVISIFTEQEIQALGVTELYELMNYVPGFQSVEGEFISGHKKLQSRGVYLDSGYVLVLRDGVPVNEVSFGKADVYAPSIDLATVEKVEIIRGPGSALYGSNAFLGVINLISKKSNDITISTGNNQYSQIVANTYSTVADGKLALNWSVKSKEGDIGTPSQLDSSETWTKNQSIPKSSDLNVNINWQKAGFDVRYLFDQYSTDKGVNLEGYHPSNYFKADNHLFSSRYKTQLSPSSNVDLTLVYKDQTIESAGFIQSGFAAPFSQDFLTGPYWQTDFIQGKVKFHNKVSNNFEVDFGVEWQKAKHKKTGVATTHITPDGQSAIPLDQYYLGEVQAFDNLGDFESLNAAIEAGTVFVQGKYLIDNKSTLHVGGRYQEYNSAGGSFTPRIALVRQLNSSSQIKFNYAEAFRAPVTNELYSNDDVTIGNPNLTAEKVKTVEAQYLYQNQILSVDFTFFNNDLSNLIASVPVDSTGKTQFQNGGNASVSGFEAMAVFNLSRGHKLRVNWTDFFSNTIENSYPYFGSVSYAGEIGKIRLGLSYLYRPAIEVVEGIRIGTTNDTVFSEKPVELFNANITYMLGRGIELTGKLMNATDVEYLAYEPRQDLNGYSVLQPGKSLIVSLKYKF
jgi:iron complex outermembrane receptor protein